MSKGYEDDYVERKARTVLRKLKRRGAVLLPVIGEVGIFGIYNAGSTSRKTSVKVPSGLVRSFLTRDWIEKIKDGYCLSEAGESWLKRASSSEDPFKMQHQTIVTREINIDGGVRKALRVNDTESPLDWLRKRKDSRGRTLINDAQYEAGEKLRRDFTFGQMGQNVTADWSVTSSSNKRKHGGRSKISGDMQDSVMDARARVMAALEYVGLSWLVL